MAQKPNPSEHPRDVVALMRSPLSDLGDAPENALRLILRLSGSLDMLLTQARRCLDLSGNEFDAVYAMWEAGRCTMSELGNRVALSRAAVTTLTDRLETKGFLSRLPDPHDRRRVLVSVTPKLEQDLFAALNEFATALADEASAHSEEWRTFASSAGRVHAITRTHIDQLRAIADASAAESDGAGHTPRDKTIAPLDDHW